MADAAPPWHLLHFQYSVAARGWWLLYSTAQREDLPTIVGSLPGGAGLWTVWTPSPAPGALGGASVDPRCPVDTQHKT